MAVIPTEGRGNSERAGGKWQQYIYAATFVLQSKCSQDGENMLARLIATNTKLKLFKLIVFILNLNLIISSLYLSLDIGVSHSAPRWAGTYLHFLLNFGHLLSAGYKNNNQN